MPDDAVIASSPASSPPAITAWQAPADQLAAALRVPVLATLDELGVIAVRGADAVSFLQGQLTNDTAGLDAARVQLAGYCTAKGRLIAVFEQWRDADGVYLELPAEILAPVLKRLSMFVLRAKARLEDASAQCCRLGLLGPGSAALVEQSFGTAPAAGATLLVDALRISRLPEGTRATERFVLRAAAGDRDALIARLAAAQRVDSGVWWWSQIDAGRPTVVAATQEAFVPQTINLEVLGGVNFKKGCYPGQEVVARSQYRGRLRRRMSLAHAEASTAAGADLYAAGEAEPVGQVVLAAAAPGGGTDLLFQCPLDRPLIEDHLLRLGGPEGVPLAVRPLPYAIVDVTA